VRTSYLIPSIKYNSCRDGVAIKIKIIAGAANSLEKEPEGSTELMPKKFLV
jgi:hypothetical protein